jgi:hypothetical protein
MHNEPSSFKQQQQQQQDVPFHNSMTRGPHSIVEISKPLNHNHSRLSIRRPATRKQMALLRSMHNTVQNVDILLAWDWFHLKLCLDAFLGILIKDSSLKEQIHRRVIVLLVVSELAQLWMKGAPVGAGKCKLNANSTKSFRTLFLIRKNLHSLCGNTPHQQCKQMGELQTNSHQEASSNGFELHRLFSEGTASLRHEPLEEHAARGYKSSHFGALSHLWYHPISGAFLRWFHLLYPSHGDVVSQGWQFHNHEGQA